MLKIWSPTHHDSTHGNLHAEPRMNADRRGSEIKLRKSAAKFVWLFRTMGQKGVSGLFAVGVDAVTVDHAVERAAVDAEDLGGARAIAARDFEDVEQVATFELVERGEIFE